MTDKGAELAGARRPAFLDVPVSPGVAGPEPGALAAREFGLDVNVVLDAVNGSSGRSFRPR
jgi:hypothetical protein